MGLRYRAAVAFVAGLLVGCGGGRKNDAGSGVAGAGAAGTAASGGGGLGGATGGAAGSGGLGGATGGAAGSGGTGGGLPACAIAVRPDDPVGTGAGCNTIVFGADWVAKELFDAADGGIGLDGGAIAAPLGGTILDGDYDLVRYRQNGVGSERVRRSLRIFDGGTFIEWLIASESQLSDGGVSSMEHRFNSSQQPSYPDQFMITLSCTDGISANSGYSYTASGDELVLFAYVVPSQPVTNVYTLRRTCTR